MRTENNSKRQKELVTGDRERSGRKMRRGKTKKQTMATTNFTTDVCQEEHNMVKGKLYFISPFMYCVNHKSKELLCVVVILFICI